MIKGHDVQRWYRSIIKSNIESVSSGLVPPVNVFPYHSWKTQQNLNMIDEFLSIVSDRWYTSKESDSIGKRQVVGKYVKEYQLGLSMNKTYQLGFH